MKISKLFHWLYAIIMMLPIFAIGVSCGYAMFNKNANKSYVSERTLAVNTLTDLNYGEEYIFNNISTDIIGSIGEQNSRIWTYDFQYNGVTYSDVVFWFYGSNSVVNIYAKDNTSNINIINDGVIRNVSFRFKYLRNSYNSEERFDIIKSTILKVDKLTLDNAFYYSLDKVTSMSIFSWAYNSFLVTPFSYIVALFSMPTNSPIVMLLSYWLAISIIWLVFDLVMYVPLLIHRWLDKGVVE